ncbi:MAG: hypothetical protein V4532_08185 [Pseudomonadota bacterium]
MQFNFISASRTGLAIIAMALGSSAWAATNVGVSVSVNQPGFYGRVDIGQQQPELIYAQPVIIQQSPVAVYQRPIYMRVPPGHSKHWGQYCGRYNACGQPVYFVHPGRINIGGPQRNQYDRGGYEDRGDNRGDRHGRGDHDRGHGRGHGHGHD